MKYLGIILDSRWSFKHHIAYASEKASRVARAVERLMPNLRGPQEPMRKLYATVVLSVILYGAHIWSKAVTSRATASQRRIQAPMNKVQRFLALRTIAAYRIVSYEAATLLARVPPAYLLAQQQRRIYERLKELKSCSDWTLDDEKKIRGQERTRLVQRWKSHLQDKGLSGICVREASLLILNEWLERGHGRMTFHLTQIITGHGCFGNFTHKIGKKSTNACDYCGLGADMAEHTVAQCSAWRGEREELRVNVGSDLSLLSLLRSMTNSQMAWNTVAKFACSVMRKKEEVDRNKDRERAEQVRLSELQARRTDSQTSASSDAR